MEDKEDEKYYKLGGMGEWNLHHSNSKLSLTVWLEMKEKLFIGDKKAISLRPSL